MLNDILIIRWTSDPNALHEKAIKIIDDKQNLLELADKELERNYSGKIFKLIMQDSELQTKIKDKYFYPVLDSLELHAHVNHLWKHLPVAGTAK